MTKIETLAKHLDCEVDDLKENDDCNFEDGGNSYMVLTDEEADDQAKEQILDSVWAFNASFLASHAKEGIDEEVIQSIQDNDRCEGNNKVLTALIEDLDHFVKDAILSDGRGHFLSSYDGEEYESGDYLIYRTN